MPRDKRWWIIAAFIALAMAIPFITMLLPVLLCDDC